MLRDLEPEDPETERLLRNSFRWQWLGLVLLGAVLMLSFVFPHADGPAIKALLAGAVIVIFYASYKLSDADGHVTFRYVHDMQYGRWRVRLVAQMVLGMIGVRYITQYPATHDVIELAMGVAMLLLPSINLIMGPQAEIDDEITRALRSRAMQAGYVATLLALMAVTAVAAYRPDALMTALAWGLFAAGAVPILSYVVLDWISDRGMDV
jgi:hypothetical protein